MFHFRESKSGACSYERGGTTPKMLGEVVHTDIEGSFRLDVNGIIYFLVSVDETSREKVVVALRTRDAAIEATDHCFDQIIRGGMSVKCINGGGAGELGRSSKVFKILAERGSGGVYLRRGHCRATGSRNGPSSRSWQQPGANC